MKTTIEPLEDGNTRIRIPIEFRYDNGRKRIFFPEMPDAHLQINDLGEKCADILSSYFKGKRQKSKE